MPNELFMILFGLVVGFYGTLAGIGGGFLIVPFLMNLYGFSHTLAVGTSLAVIFANSLSGSASYLYQKRVDLEAGIKFALATIPGVFIGVKINHQIDTGFFRIIFGVFLLLIAGLILFKKTALMNAKTVNASERIAGRWPRAYRKFIDRHGVEFEYEYNELHGIILSFFVGIIASLFGIGGGIMHVPAMIFIFSFPAHIATATSHFILCVTALTSAILYGTGNSIDWGMALWMAGGAIVGAQIGGTVSRRFRGIFILRLISVLLVFLAIQMIFKFF
ncbi:MAG: sulfite exporter TauE/SafE family protein [Planctomycetes bacterium]|nr:sulfite exporter TauE/SafE family protein [Planctomycetota bacterium]